jgi:diaminopimelate epimerase
MGNPHVTFFATPLDQAPVLGPAIERDPLFPDRVNAGFAAVQADGSIRLRVWERGAGLTLACGSGACAALVNAHRRGLTGRSAAVAVDGGTLHITWREDGHVLMTGPVATAFSGEFDTDDYPA